MRTSKTQVMDGSGKKRIESIGPNTGVIPVRKGESQVVKGNYLIPKDRFRPTWGRRQRQKLHHSVVVLLGDAMPNAVLPPGNAMPMPNAALPPGNAKGANGNTLCSHTVFKLGHPME